MRRLILPAWCAGLASVLLALHLLSGSDLAVPGAPSRWAGWLDRVGPATAVVGVLRILALGLAWYLVLATIVGAASRVAQRERAVATADLVTPRFLRRLLASASGLAISGVGLALASTPVLVGVEGAGSSSQPTEVSTATLQRISPVEVKVPALVDGVPARPAQDASVSTAELSVLDLSGLGEALAATVDAPTTVVDETWEVAAGDHLWMIAEEVLTESIDSTPSEAEVARYWRQLIEANRDRLVAPDNPDLLYPGQVLTIPAPTAGR